MIHPKQKILVVLPTDILGGAENVLKTISKFYLSHESFTDVVFLQSFDTRSWDDLKKFEGFKIISLNTLNRIIGIIKFIKFLLSSSNNYDKVFSSHTHINSLVGFLRRLKILNAKKLFVRESTVVFDRFFGPKRLVIHLLYFLGYQHVDLVICQTDIMKRKLLENVAFITNKTLVIPNPADLEKFDKMSKKTLNDDLLKTKFIVAAGRLIQLKGFDVLIRAFSLLAEMDHDLKLIILGKGEELRNLISLTKGLGLKNKVVFKGQVENVFPYFKNAQCCVVSSLVEGFPNVLLQMISQNNRVVSTLCAGGIDEIEGIFTSEINNHEILANTIQIALTSNVEKNRIFFNNELKNRSIKKFIQRIEEIN